MAVYRWCAVALAVLPGGAAVAAAPPPVLQTRPAGVAPPPSPAPVAAPASAPGIEPAAAIAPAAALLPSPSRTEIAAGVPLRIQLDGGYPLRAGTRIEGHLIDPVYRVDHILLPVGTRVSGVIRATHPVKRGARANAMLDGDFTPLALGDVTFDSLTLPGGSVVPIRTEARERTAKMIHVGKSKKPSLVGMVKEQVRQRKQDAIDIVAAPGKTDRLRRYVYGQLPYHPQRIWEGTQYDADLTAPLTVADSTPPWPVAALGGESPVGTIEARLTTALSSATTQKGAPVEAVLSRPLIDQAGHSVVLAEGTRITGSVLQVRPAAWFGRSGRLRFTFRSLEPVPGTLRVGGAEAGANAAGLQTAHGQVIGAEATGDQNLSIDQEGGAKAGADKNKLLAPLLLGLLATSSMDSDRNHEGDAVKNGVTSNGFGLAARLLTIATGNRNLASGFAYFALSKSIYRRWIAKGHETVFPRDTLLEVELAAR